MCLLRNLQFSHHLLLRNVSIFKKGIETFLRILHLKYNIRSFRLFLVVDDRINVIRLKRESVKIFKNEWTNNGGRIFNSGYFWKLAKRIRYYRWTGVNISQFLSFIEFALNESSSMYKMKMCKFVFYNSFVGLFLSLVSCIIFIVEIRVSIGKQVGGKIVGYIYICI